MALPAMKAPLAALRVAGKGWLRPCVTLRALPRPRAAHIFGLVKMATADKGNERTAIIQLESRPEQTYGGYTLRASGVQKRGGGGTA